MRTIFIEWKHFEKVGKTCDRCANTGINLTEVIEELAHELKSQSVRLKLRETKLTEHDMAESNMLLIDGTPLEELIPEARADENACCSCSQLTGKHTDCRTIQHGGITYEDIPKEMIKTAIKNRIETYNATGKSAFV